MTVKHMYYLNLTLLLRIKILEGVNMQLTPGTGSQLQLSCGNTFHKHQSFLCGSQRAEFPRKVSVLCFINAQVSLASLKKRPNIPQLQSHSLHKGEKKATTKAKSCINLWKGVH